MACGDIVPAADGQRYRGVVLACTDDWAVVWIRPPLPGRGPLDGIRCVRRNGAAITFEPLATGTGPPPDPSGETATSVQIVREAVLLAEDHRPRDAVLALQRLVTTARPAGLRAAEAWCRQNLHRELASWLARLRLESALRPDAPQALKLTYVTPYEQTALARLLRALLEQKLSVRHAGRTIEQWAREPDTWRQLDPQAPALVRDARLAAATARALVRWDPGLRADAAARSAMVRLAGQLARLCARIESLPGYTDLVARSRGLAGSAPPATMPASTRPATRAP